MQKHLDKSKQDDFHSKWVNTDGVGSVGGDKVVHGDEVHGNKVMGDKVEGDKHVHVTAVPIWMRVSGGAAALTALANLLLTLSPAFRQVVTPRQRLIVATVATVAIVGLSVWVSIKPTLRHWRRVALGLAGGALVAYALFLGLYFALAPTIRIMVADFGPPAETNIRAQLRSALDREIAPSLAADIRVDKYDDTIETSTEARRIGQEWLATMVVWGFQSEGKVEVNLTLVRERELTVSLPQDIQAQVPFEVASAPPPRTILDTNLVIRYPAANAALPLDTTYFTYLIVSQMYLERGKLGEARETLDSALSKAQSETPGLASAYFLRGVLHQLQGDWAGAEEDFSRGLELDPYYVEAYNNRGAVRVKLGRLRDAESDFSQAIGLQSDYAPAHNNRGIVRLLMSPALEVLMGERQEAVLADFSQALDLGYTQAYFNRSFLHMWASRYEEAISDLSKAIAHGLETALVYQTRAVAYRMIGQGDLALNDINEALRLEPQDPTLLVWRGVIHKDRAVNHRDWAEYEKAVKDFSQAIAVDPQGPETYDAHHLRTEAYVALGRYDEALADYDWLIASNLERGLTENPYDYGDRAKIHHLQGDVAAALQDYGKAIELDPEPWFYLDRGRVYLADGQLEAAIADFSQAIALDEHYTDAYESRAQAATQAGDYQQAVDDYSYLIDRFPSQRFAASYYKGRGLAYKALGRNVEAITDLEEYLELNPFALDEEEIREIIATLK